jgi:AcrR family transcriptional regulator
MLSRMPHLQPVQSLELESPHEPPPFSPRQEEVLDVVEGVFRRDGLRPVRIGPLAAEARCSRRTLYELARSKEELFLVVVERIMRRIARQGREAIEQEADPLRRIVAMGNAAADGLGALTPPFMDAIQAHLPAQALYDQHIAAARTTLEALISDGIEQGLLRMVNAETAAEAVLVLVLHFTNPRRPRSARHSPADALMLVFDLFISGAETRT